MVRNLKVGFWNYPTSKLYIIFLAGEYHLSMELILGTFTSSAASVSPRSLIISKSQKNPTADSEVQELFTTLDKNPEK